MSVIFEFGNREQPLGNFDPKLWQRARPNWKQIRSIGCAEVKTPMQECGNVDALWTREARIPVGVITADCVPLLLYRNDLKAVAAIHAGWEGTLQQIVPHFFNTLPGDLRNPTEWTVKIGPSIRACCYEFGLDLIERFRMTFPALKHTEMTPSPRRLDLIAILRHQLNEPEVTVEFIDKRCTYCSMTNSGGQEFFSYRKGDRNTRQYSIVMKTI